MTTRWLLAAVLATTLWAGRAHGAIAASPAIWYFARTGHSLSLGFGQFVATHGGTTISGLPITEEIVEDGVTVQYFQNLRLEWHPERSPGAQVTVTALGLVLHKAQPPVASTATPTGALYVATSGHTLADGFLAFYQANDGPVLLGPPLTEELQEGGAVVQYFANGELQWRPDGGVSMAPIGETAALARGWTPSQPPLAPVPQPANAGQGDAPSSNGPIPAVAPPSAAGRLTLPVLMYHHVGSWPSPYSVSTPDFTAQLDWLQGHGYHAVNLRQAFVALFGGAALPANPVAISVDDGYPDAATNARQILLDHHMTATFFIPTWQTPLKPATLQQMEREGFDIEAHSRTHPDLTTLNEAAAFNEIAGSKQDLERILGHSVELFAYPYGAVNANIAGMVRRAGFRGGILASAGRTYAAATPFTEPRILVDRGDDLANFVAKVTGAPYRDTLAVGAPLEPKPEYQLAPPATSAAPGNGAANAAGTAGGATDPNGASGATDTTGGSGASDSGAPPPAGDQTTPPTGRGQQYV